MILLVIGGFVLCGIISKSDKNISEPPQTETKKLATENNSVEEKEGEYFSKMYDNMTAFTKKSKESLWNASNLFEYGTNTLNKENHQKEIEVIIEKSKSAVTLGVFLVANQDLSEKLFLQMFARAKKENLNTLNDNKDPFFDLKYIQANMTHFIFLTVIFVTANLLISLKKDINQKIADQMFNFFIQEFNKNFENERLTNHVSKYLKYLYVKSEDVEEYSNERRKSLGYGDTDISNIIIDFIRALSNINLETPKQETTQCTDLFEKYKKLNNTGLHLVEISATSHQIYKYLHLVRALILSGPLSK